MHQLLTYLTPATLCAVGLLLIVFLFFSRHYTLTNQHLAEQPKDPLSLAMPYHAMTRGDRLPLLLVTVVYACTAFFQLGSTVAPQNFATFTKGQTVTITLDQCQTISSVGYYAGLDTGDYTLSASEDGLLWTEVTDLTQSYDLLFRWNFVELDEFSAQYLRIAANQDDLQLGELALYDGDGNTIAIPLHSGPAAPLTDEQDTVPLEYSYLNSSYFDEIYHARTAYEHVEGVYPYELSHPPLGKLLIGVGIRLFGMTPFGWRFVGTSFGVAMLPVLYCFIKNFFGKTALATCGTILLATEFMHLTQTRIATIDTYGVFFILTMYYFLYRWMAAKPQRITAGLGWLFLCGLCFGLGAACKWIVFYGGAGMAILYFIHLYLRWREHPWNGVSYRYGHWVALTVGCSLLFFVAIPSVIYTLSYLPYLTANGESGLSALVSTMWDNQVFMFTYHTGVDATHPYSSAWYQWLLDIRPILYYREYTADGLRATISAFNNPLISWAGLLAILTVFSRVVTARCGRALFLVVGFLAQLLPWVPITRPLFAYHYFPATIFLILALCYVMNEMMDATALTGKWRRGVYGFTALSTALYALFYPALIGLPVPTWYAQTLLIWLPSWPL